MSDDQRAEEAIDALCGALAPMLERREEAADPVMCAPGEHVLISEVRDEWCIRCASAGETIAGVQGREALRREGETSPAPSSALGRCAECGAQAVHALEHFDTCSQYARTIAIGPYEHSVICVASPSERWQCPGRGCKVLPPAPSSSTERAWISSGDLVKIAERAASDLDEAPPTGAGPPPAPSSAQAEPMPAGSGGHRWTCYHEPRCDSFEAHRERHRREWNELLDQEYRTGWREGAEDAIDAISEPEVVSRADAVARIERMLTPPGEAPRYEPTPDCDVEDLSSRMCWRGVPGCVVDHNRDETVAQSYVRQLEAELAALRRVAEAARAFFSQPYDNGQHEEALRDALAALPARKDGGA